MAERSVVWKAIADFSAISRQARKARQELEELEKTSQRQGQSSAQSAREQASANKGVADSQRDSANASNIAFGMLGRLSAARKAQAAAANEEANAVNRATVATQNLNSAQNSSASATDGVARRLNQASSAADSHAAALDRTSASHRRFGTSAGSTSRILMGLRNALSSVSGGSSSTVFDRIGGALRGMDNDTRRATSNMEHFQSVVSNFRSNEFLSFLRQATMSRLPVRLQMMGNAAIVAGDAIGALGGAIAGLGTGLVSMVGALGPVIGLLGALPGVALAAAGGFGSLLGSLSGVGGAMKAYDQTQKAAARSSGTNARRTIDNNKKTAQSERNLAAQRRASAKAIRDAERGIQDARERAAQVQVDTARQIVNAEKGIVKAKERVADAERSLVRAQNATTQARVEAAKRLKELERQTKSYALSEESASLSLEESRRRLIEVMNDPGSTDIERRAADLAVREAEARLEDIRYASAEHDAELADARKKGIEGSDQVVSALESEQDAYRSIQDAKESVGEAELNLADTRADAARSIRDANEAVARAEESLAEAHLKSTEQMENANDVMDGYAAAAIPAVAGTNAFADAMAKLTPEAQAVVWQLLRMREGWEEVRKAAERAVLPGVLVFLQSVEKLFPTITDFVSAAGREVGGFAADLGRMISSESAINKWNTVLEDAVQIVANWRIGLLNVAQVIGDIAVAAADSGLNDWLWGIVVGWTEVWKSFTAGEEGQRRLIAFFEKTMERAELLGSIVGGLVGFFYNVGRIGDEAGVKIWRSFDNALKTFNAWSKTEEGFKAIKAVADASVPIFQELGLLVVEVAKGMGELLVRGDAGGFIRLLRVELLPVLMDIFRLLQDKNIAGSFISALSSIGRTLVDSGLLSSLADLLLAVMALAVEAFPLLAPVIKVVIDVLAGLVKGLTFVLREINRGSILGKIFAIELGKLGLVIAGITFVAALAGIGRFITRMKEMAAGARSTIAILKNMAEAVKTAFSGARRSAGFTDDDNNIPRRAVAAEAPPLDDSKARRAAHRSGIEVMKDYGEGLIVGARALLRKLTGAGEDVAEELIDGTEDELGISSPSREGIRIGRNFGDSVADGARDERRNVRRAGDQLGNELGEGAETSVRNRGGRLRSVVGSIFQVAAGAALAAGAGLTALGVSSIQAHGQLQQVVRKTTTLFGDSSRSMQQWADTASVSMGLTRQETLNVANGFGALFTQMGFSKQRSAELSQEFTTLAAGIAAANPGVEVTDAFQALEAAFQGDYAAISQLNPAINEQAVLQRALEMTGKSSTAALTEQEKQAALLSVAHGQAAQASKDLAAQQDTTAGAMQRAQARWQTFREKLGEKLDTKLKPVADDLEKLLGNEQLIDDLATVLGTMADALAAVARALDEYFKIRAGEKSAKFLGMEHTNVDEEATKVGADKEWRKRREQELGRKVTVEDIRTEARNRVVARGGNTSAHDRIEADKRFKEEDERRNREAKAQNQRPAAPAVTAGAGGRGGGAAPGSAQQTKKLGNDVVGGLEQGIEEKGPGFWTFIGNWINKYIIKPVKEFLGIASPSTVFAGFGGDLVNGLIEGFRTFWGNFGALFSGLWTGFLTLLGNGLTWVTTTWNVAWTGISTFFSGIWTGISTFFSGIWTGIQTIFGMGITWIQNTWSTGWTAVSIFFSTIWTGISTFFSGVWSGFQTLLGIGLTWIQNTWRTVWNAISLFFSTIWNSLVTFFRGVWAGLQGLFNQGLEFIKNIWNAGWTWIRTTATNIWNSIRQGVDSFFSGVRSAFQTGVDAIGRIWEGIREKTRAPVKFVVDTVYTGGIKKLWDAVAGLVNLPKAPDVSFASGGYTGAGSRYQPAGVVHADEYVINKPSRRKFESKNPGLLDYINRTGTLPERRKPGQLGVTYGYKDGGQVGEEGPRHGFADRVLFQNRGEGLTPEGHIPFMGGAHPLQSLFAALFMGGAAPVPGGRVTNFHGQNGAYHGTRWAGDMAMPTGTPVYAWKAGSVAQTQRLAGSYGLNIIVNHAGGERSRYAHLSAFAVSVGQQVAQGQRIGSVGSTGNSTGPHLHFEVLGGNSPLNFSGLSASGSATAAPAITAFDQMKDLITDPVNSMKQKFGDSPWVDMVMKIPTTLADKAKSFLDEKLAAIVDAIPFVPGGSGSVPGLSGVTANTYAKAANIYQAATGAGHRISTVGGWRSDWEHSSRRALDFMVSNKAAGDYIASYVLGNKDRFGLQHVIWWQRINSGSGWRSMSDRGSPTQNHLDHDHVFFNASDKGFALEVSTPVMTQNRGWVKHGDLAVGDFVYDESGSPTMVTQVRHWVDRPSYVVKFSDGAEIIADENHLWQVRDCRLTYRKKEDVRVVDTKWMSENLKLNTAGANRLSVDLGGGFEGTHKDFRIDPYVLGYWLGDGTSSCARIRVEGKDLDDLEKNLTACGETFKTTQTSNSDYFMVQLWGKNVPESSWRTGTKHLDAFSARLKEYNLLNNKHIPEDYMLASFDQRLALLQGLMDSDGNISKKQGLCEFSQNGRKELSLQVLELALGLGIKAKMYSYLGKIDNRGFNEDARYPVRFTTDVPVFRMERKANDLQEHVNNRKSTKRYTRRHITGVVPVGNFDTNCITVDSPNHLYLAGEHFIPTHNSTGGWTGSGARMKPAGVVHADEFVIKKPSRRSFEKKHPGVLDFINKTGQLPAAPDYTGYHGGGLVKTGATGEGSTGGAWWRKGTTFGTNKWLGALRHFLGLDNWWAGWDDDLDRAIRDYDGRPATHVYGPWRGIMDSMKRLPVSEFTSAQNVASKIGVNVDTIFRMMDTNRAHFNRDLGDRAKNDAMERSYSDFRNFHRESVEELQTVMGVEVTGYWSEEMRKLLEHLKHHVAGTAHPDNLATAGGWSTVGAWGEAFNEIYRTIKINEEWDKMMDQFFVWGYDSLMRFLGEKGTSQGMELARDLYNNQMNARDADVYYRHYYEREDAIKDEQSELNRLRRLVNILRRYDDVGLQGLSSQLELTMDTTAMLYKKAKDKDMLNGVSLSKTHRLDKDVIEFDDLFRFAMGGMVPGRGNIDSVLALLTPGEYVLTKEETKRLMTAQDMIAKYRNPSVSTDIPGMMAGAGAVTNIVNNNTTNNVTATIISNRPELAGVAFQKHMKNLRDNGMFGVDDG